MGHETSEVSAGAWMDLLLYTNGCKYTYICNWWFMIIYSAQPERRRRTRTRSGGAPTLPFPRFMLPIPPDIPLDQTLLRMLISKSANVQIKMYSFHLHFLPTRPWIYFVWSDLTQELSHIILLIFMLFAVALLILGAIEIFTAGWPKQWERYEWIRICLPEKDCKRHVKK